MKTLFTIISFLFPIIIFSSSPFSDISPSDKNYKAVNYLFQKGVIWWYADWSYKPNRDVNRVEALKILLLWAQIPVNESHFALNFKDTDSNSWYAKYLSVGQNLWIIKWYSDWLFKPDNTVNLAESLKMLLKTNNVSFEETVNQSPFLDVPKDAWFAAYMQYAKVNWILDYPSNWLVYPWKKMNRAEFAQIIYKFAKNQEKKSNNELADMYPNDFEWKKTTSWEQYSNNKLTASHRSFPIGSRVKVMNTDNLKSVLVVINDNNLDNPDREIRLSKKAFYSISDMEAVLIPIKLTKQDWEIEIAEEILKSTDTCQYPDHTNKINKWFFNLINLESELESVFRENEIYNIRWTIWENIKEVTAFIIEEDWSKSPFYAYVKNWFFSVDVDMWPSWEKQIWIITWKSWSSYLWDINVVKITCEREYKTSHKSVPKNLSYKIKNNDTYFKWEWTWSLIRLVVKQWDNQVVKYINKKDNYIKLNPMWFKGFSQWEAFFQISLTNSSSPNSLDQDSAWAISQNEKINIVKHHYSLIDNSIIEPSEQIQSVYKFWWSISIKAIAKNDIKTESDIILPNNKVESVLIGANKKMIKNDNWVEIFPVLSEFEFLYKPKQHWTYIIEINHSSWIAWLNIPVYEQWSIPLIPDYRDTITEHDRLTEINLSNYRSQMIGLINKDRKLVWLKRLMLNPSLNELAQQRANYIANNDHISHWTKEWKTINDLRFNFWIKSQVSENIAREANVEYAHLWLMRSAGHRKNILDEDWSRLWVWFSIDKDWYLIVVEAFSSSPIEEYNLDYLRTQITERINLKRAELLVPSSILHAISQNWTDLMVEKNFFDFEWPWDESFNDEITNAWIRNQAWTFIVAHSIWKWILDEVESHERIYDPIWEKIWVWIKQDPNWIIKVTVIYTR